MSGNASLEVEPSKLGLEFTITESFVDSATVECAVIIFDKEEVANLYQYLGRWMAG